MTDETAQTPETPETPTEDPLTALQREFSQLCLSGGGTEAALGHLIAHAQRQTARLSVLLAYTDPQGAAPPPGTPREVLEMQMDMHLALRQAETRQAEAEFWMTRAAGIRQHMRAALGRKAPPE